MPHYTRELWFSDAENLSKTETGPPPREVPKCRGGRLTAGAVAENWRLSMRSIGNLARSQVHHTEHPPYVFLMRHVRCDAAHRAGFVSDS